MRRSRTETESTAPFMSVSAAPLDSTKLLTRSDSLWTFLYIKGAEPTNNVAERAVRHGVLRRKTRVVLLGALIFFSSRVAGSAYAKKNIPNDSSLRLPFYARHSLRTKCVPTGTATLLLFRNARIVI